MTTPQEAIPVKGYKQEGVPLLAAGTREVFQMMLGADLTETALKPFKARSLLPW
jgi:hypothetical protein